MNQELPLSDQTPIPLRRAVLSRIEREGICPRGRWWFTCTEGMWWCLWVATVAVAAVAVAVSFFVIMHRQYAFFEATHDTFLGFMLEVLPYLWLGVFAATAGLAYAHIRHTKRGYRYRGVSIVGISIAVSCVGGWLFHIVGMSFVFDDALGKHFPSWYTSQAMIEKRFWQQPEQGRLLAVYRSEPEPGETVLVEDVASSTWQLTIAELFPEDLAALRAGELVRVLGRPVTPESDRAMHACGVFTWYYDYQWNMERFKSDREEAIARLRDHRDRARYEAKVRFENGGVIPVAVASPERLCGEIAAVKRLR